MLEPVFSTTTAYVNTAPAPTLLRVPCTALLSSEVEFIVPPLNTASDSVVPGNDQETPPCPVPLSITPCSLPEPFKS